MTEDERLVFEHRLTLLTREELVSLVRGFNLCYDHFKQKLTGGTYAGCLHCGAIEDSRALSEIDSLVDDACGRSNEMRVSAYDIGYDPSGVVRRVKEFLASSGIIP